MSLQDIYYLMSIIYMSTLIVILVIVAALLFVLMKKVNEISDNINDQITKVGRITSNAEEVASGVTAVASGVLRRVSKFTGSKKRDD
jgi:hypothetical protein